MHHIMMMMMVMMRLRMILLIMIILINEGSGLAGRLADKRAVIEDITTESADLADCIDRYEKKSAGFKVRTCCFVVYAVGAAFRVGRSPGPSSS